MSIKRYEQGQPRPGAGRLNEMVDQLNRNICPGGSGPLQYGSGGVAFNPPPRTLLGLFQLTEAMVYPDGTDPDEADVPYVDNARQVWLNHSSDQYGETSDSPNTTLYHPTCLRDAAGLPPSTASFGSGDRVWAVWNMQSGRWEILDPAERLRRFEMGEALNSGGSATVGLQVWNGSGWTEDDAETTFTVYDYQQRFSKMATASGDVGARGIARYMADKGAWEILDMQIPGEFWGTLQANLSTSTASIQVAVVFDAVFQGYNLFGINHGNLTTAYNPVGSGNQGTYWWSGASGDRVFCKWDVEHAKYWIMLVEPNAQNWQTLDVVTSISVNFAAQTYTYTTRQIELPPWTTIGSSVVH